MQTYLISQRPQPRGLHTEVDIIDWNRPGRGSIHKNATLRWGYVHILQTQKVRVQKCKLYSDM